MFFHALLLHHAATPTIEFLDKTAVSQVITIRIFRKQVNAFTAKTDSMYPGDSD